MRSLDKELYFDLFIKRIFYKFYFLTFSECPKFLNLNVNLNQIEDNYIFLYYYFLEHLFLKKPKFLKGKMSYLATGKKVYSSNLVLNITDFYIIFNFLKIYFISSKEYLNRSRLVYTITKDSIDINYILNDFILKLYKDILTNILNVILINLKIKNGKKFLNIHISRILGLI